jgi:hypothetical protein
VEEWDGLVVYYDCPISCGDVPWPRKIYVPFEGGSSVLHQDGLKS